MHTPKVTE